tara:strand:+ start:570 stop:2657 length:2088 start_codon:yes stop_codon:yes gene_type:complete
VSIVSIVVLYFSYRFNHSFSETSILIFFRALILAFLILLIFNPVIEKKSRNKISLPWHIYIDESLSMKYHKQPSALAYKEGIKNFFRKIREKEIKFEAFSFGSGIDSITEISDIGLDANSTNMGLIFDNINNDYQNNLGGVIIFTDGQINQGPPIQEFYDGNSKLAIYTIGVGDTTPMLDIFIRSVDTPPLSVKGQNVNIDVIISGIGNINERVNVNLFDEKNKLIGSKLINIGSHEENEIIRFQISPDKIGENNFYVKCSALSDEINIQNNQQKIKLYVMKDNYNIALVTGAPNYNTRLIKKFMKEQGNNNIDHYVMNSKNFNQKLKEFLEKKYEVIIFDNNPVSSNFQKWESIVRVFAKKLISHNSSFFIIPGPEVDLHSLNKYLNIIDIEAKLINGVLKAKTDWKFTESWHSSNIIGNEKFLLNNFHSFPPQIPAFKLDKKRDGESKITYAKYFDNEFESPLLVMGEKQQIRYALWNSINLASLNYMLSDSDLNYLFEESMRKIMNWLMKKSDNREFVFRTDKNSYQHGELISLTGVSSDLKDNFKINDAVVELYHNNQYISSKPLLYDLNDKKYKSKFWAPKPGSIDYIIKVNKGIDSYEVNSGSFKVQESHIELNKIFLNKNKLIILSETSGAIFRDWENRDDVISAISDVEKMQSYVSLFTFRYNYFYIGLIFLLLSLEWLYRKKIGLM